METKLFQGIPWILPTGRDLTQMSQRMHSTLVIEHIHTPKGLELPFDTSEHQVREAALAASQANHSIVWS